MANVARPPLRQTRLSFPPMVAPNEDAQRSNASHSYNPRAHNAQSHVQSHTHTHTHTHSHNHNHNHNHNHSLAHGIPARHTPRTLSRKRPATVLSPDPATARPPAKVRVTRPHGELVRLSNGGAAPLGSTADEEAPPTATTSQDKRSLRSHDGSSRLKSDLPTYFANYAEVMAGLPQSSGLLDFETPMYLVDEPAKPTTTTPHTPRPAASPSILPSPLPSSTAFQVLDYTATAKTLPSHPNLLEPPDPLADTVFFASHRRAERKEKQLRNIEKERAMHEKVQLERLLDGLQGPDWLKVMGITGVTDGERKDWEPKRDYFVREVEALVDKFRAWKDEEKRLRAEKDAALAAQDPDPSPSSPDPSDDDDSDDDDDDDDDNQKHTTHSKHPSPPKKTRRPPRPHGFLLPGLPPEPSAPFTSFYPKPHLRAVALAKHRHARNTTAFGLPIPDWDDRLFELPRGVLGEDVLRDNARRRRRRKRESGGSV